MGLLPATCFSKLRMALRLFADLTIGVFSKGARFQLTSRNQEGERGRRRMRRGEAAGPSLAFWALSLASAFSGTFGANFMMRALTVKFREGGLDCLS